LATSREAAEQARYPDHREVYRWAKRAGLLDVHSKRLVASYRRIAARSNEELERRLIEAPGEITTKDLAVISGDLLPTRPRSTKTGAGKSTASPAQPVSSSTDSRPC
jgi:hypothetical protein